MSVTCTQHCYPTAIGRWMVYRYVRHRGYCVTISGWGWRRQNAAREGIE
jgi:hypothetical protein